MPFVIQGWNAIHCAFQRTWRHAVYHPCLHLRGMPGSLHSEWLNTFQNGQANDFLCATFTAISAHNIFAQPDSCNMIVDLHSLCAWTRRFEMKVSNFCRISIMIMEYHDSERVCYVPVFTLCDTVQTPSRERRPTMKSIFLTLTLIRLFKTNWQHW